MIITAAPAPIQRFDRGSLAGLDEPVRRCLTHAIAEGSEIQAGVRLRMAGRIEVGRWLALTAEQEITESAFSWRACAGWGPFKVLRLVDSYAPGVGSTESKVLGRWRFMHADGEDTARAAAGPGRRRAHLGAGHVPARR